MLYYYVNIDSIFYQKSTSTLKIEAFFLILFVYTVYLQYTDRKTLKKTHITVKPIHSSLRSES